ncbi:hypothetical protein WJX77_001494 [Trebouxia sp. C0004]
MYELALQALDRQQKVNAVFETSNENQPQTTTEQEVVSRQAEVRPATKVLKENVPPAKEHPNKQKKNVVQYSRRPVPTAKQKEQALQTQHLLEMKEYFAEVDDFQLTEETPVKAKPNSRSRTPVAASPEASEPQARPARGAASAEQRTAEWVTALSPVLEHDEGQNPGVAPQTHATEASPAETGSGGSTAGPLPPPAHSSPQHQKSTRPERKSCYGLSRRASLVVAPCHSLAVTHDDDFDARKQSLAPSLMSRLSSRFSIGNRLARLSTNWGMPEALQRLGLVNPSAPVHLAQPHCPPQQSPIAEEASEEFEQAVKATSVNSAESHDAAEQAAAAAGAADMAAGTAAEGSDAAAQAVAADMADHDTAGRADDAREQEPLSSEQLPRFKLHCAREDAAKQDAASPCTAQLTSSSSERPQKENQQPDGHRSSSGAKKWTQQLHSPTIPSQDVRSIMPALHQSSASDLLAPQQDASHLAIPDTPDATQQAASNFYSRAATAADEGPIATGMVYGIEDVAAEAAAQAAAAGAVEADVAAVSGQLSELELMPLKQLLKLCGQDVDVAKLPSMEELIGQFASLAHIKKIGEGTFGEAFKADQVVFKIVPLEGDLQVNGETQKRSEEILAEVAIALTLSRLRESTSGPEHSQSDNNTEGFVQTHGLGICHGRYAKTLIQEWHRWDHLHESENDAVDAFPGDQLYVVFVFADGGADLERFELRSFEEAQSILLQTALSLAVAEEACEFEHRDLHWGNLLARRDSNRTISCRLRGHDIEASSSGVTVTLIDFTLSRLTALTGDVAFCDLAADPELFTGPKGDVQADTYRRMKKATRNRWQGHCPATNCLWMHYLADVILNLKKIPMTAQQKKGLRDFRKRALGYRSSTELVWDEIFTGCWLAGPLN